MEIYYVNVIVVLIAVAAALLYAAIRSSVLRVERSVLIEAGAEKIYPFIHDMRSFNAWNPFSEMYSAAQMSYGGPASGVGARFDFQGGESTGTGRVQIVEASFPNRVTMQHDMFAPVKSRSTIDFMLTPRGSSTEVAVVLQSRCSYIAKLVNSFVKAERLIGRQYEAGLARLKALAEQP